MIGKLNHIAIAVPNINEAAEQYRSIFGAKVSEPVEQPDHGVTTIFIDCLLYTSPSPRDATLSRMPSSA